MEIFEIRKTLEASVEKKLKANVTNAGTLLDGTEADFAFEVKNNRYNVTIRKEKYE